MHSYNHKMGQKLQTDVEGVVVDRAFRAHFQVLAADAVAANNTGVHAGIILAAGGSTLAVNLTDPAVPRAARIKGNVAGIAGNVVLTGTNYADEEITETIATNGVAVVEGAKAFKTVDKVTLPARTHVPAFQTETQLISHKADAAGTITVTVTAAVLDAPKAIAVEVEQDDTAIEVATLIVAAINADADVAPHFTASNAAGTSATVTLTSDAYLADDGTLAMGFVDTDTTGVTAGASTNGTAGVAQDIVSIGWNDKLGLPYLLERNTVDKVFLNNVLEAAPTVTVSATAIESNTIDLASALDGHQVDVYLDV